MGFDHMALVPSRGLAADQGVAPVCFRAMSRPDALGCDCFGRTSVTNFIERAVALHAGCQGLGKVERLQIALHEEALGPPLDLLGVRGGRGGVTLPRIGGGERPGGCGPAS